MCRTKNRPMHRPRAARGNAALFILLLVVLGLPLLACASGEFQLPTPRRLVIYSGARLTPEKERMEGVDARIREQWDSINVDPSFMIITEAQEGPVYPWERLRLNAQGDTANVSWQPGGGLRRGAYLIYAHLHLMAAQGRLDRWLPDAVGAGDFELERAILRQVADVWLYQRSIFDARPYSILDEIAYASENGFLDEFILTARPGSFVEARREWQAANPEGNAAYVEWFQRTFERDPPGWSGGSPGS